VEYDAETKDAAEVSEGTHHPTLHFRPARAKAVEYGAKTEDEAREKVTLKSRVRRHIRICVTRTVAEPETAT